MQQLKTKIDYLLRSLKNTGQKKQCPFCGATSYTQVDSKYLVTKLLRCTNCNLQYRFPKDDENFLNQFYQSDYKIDVAMITDLPTDEQLGQLKRDNFNSVKDYVPYVKTFFGNKKIQILDYGCSWGYSLYTLKQDGHNAMGFEVSRPRAAFGRAKLDIDIYSSPQDIPKGFDMIVSSHVIEHLTDINNLIQNAKSVLKPSGILQIFCPNGSREYRDREPYLFHVNWGFLHPNYLDINFASHAFANYPYYITTADWVYDQSMFHAWDRKTQFVDTKKDGKELFITVIV